MGTATIDPYITRQSWPQPTPEASGSTDSLINSIESQVCGYGQARIWTFGEGTTEATTTPLSFFGACLLAQPQNWSPASYSLPLPQSWGPPLSALLGELFKSHSAWSYEASSSNYIFRGNDPTKAASFNSTYQSSTTKPRSPTVTPSATFNPKS